MRMAMLSLVLLGCSSPETRVAASDAGTVTPEGDATAPEQDAGVDAEVPCVPTESCGLMEQETCAGGVVYGCTNGSCPSVDSVGACRALAWDAKLGSGRSCCEQAACTRSKVPTDEVCSRPQTDAGTKKTGWVCPKGEKPEGACLGLHGPASQEFCCED